MWTDVELRLRSVVWEIMVALMETSTVAFNTLWDQMHSRLCWFVCSRISDGQDAEDLLQDIFLRIYDQSSSLRDPQRSESWMYQIARNRIIDHYRSRRNLVELPETLVADEAFENEASGDETVNHLVTYLREAMDALPEAYREALIQADIRGMAQQDLAGKLGISLSGAKSRVQRARQKVKDAMLRCFDFEFDARGQIMDYRQNCCCSV